MKDLEKGFIALFRQFTEWEWYDDANTMRLFIHCLLLANYKDKKWRGKLIKRGSFITSQSKLAHSLKLSIKQIRGSLTKLKTTGEVAVLSTPEYSIITVKNYDFYQGEGRQKGRQKAEEGQTDGRQRATTNKDNNIHIYSNNIISLSNKKKNISKNEREILKKYLLNKKRTKPIEDVDAYIGLLVKNGDIQYNLERALKWQERQEQKKQKLENAAAEKKAEVKPTKEEIEAGIKYARAAIEKIKKGQFK